MNNLNRPLAYSSFDPKLYVLIRVSSLTLWKMVHILGKATETFKGEKFEHNFLTICRYYI